MDEARIQACASAWERVLAAVDTTWDEYVYPQSFGTAYSTPLDLHALLIACTTYIASHVTKQELYMFCGDASHTEDSTENSSFFDYNKLTPIEVIVVLQELQRHAGFRASVDGEDAEKLLWKQLQEVLARQKCISMLELEEFAKQHFVTSTGS